MALFISGTASIVGHESLHAGDVQRQTEETLANIDSVLEAAESSTHIRFRAEDLCMTIYVRHRADLPVVRAALARHLGADSVAATTAVYLWADVCRAELLVEIEAHGFAAAGNDT